MPLSSNHRHQSIRNIPSLCSDSASAVQCRPGLVSQDFAENDWGARVRVTDRWLGVDVEAVLLFDGQASPVRAETEEKRAKESKVRNIMLEFINDVIIFQQCFMKNIKVTNIKNTARKSAHHI